MKRAPLHKRLTKLSDAVYDGVCGDARPSESVLFRQLRRWSPSQQSSGDDSVRPALSISTTH